ncbi:hypothetical protein HAX54_007800 [Datura stramonium]|uniref:Uncharacterized protein n=1 Tax=Datura stramonium TaxID=4076 RepID=A0ABS8RJN4_DATST|nr:hypothetical protein [Datura stramonium]
MNPLENHSSATATSSAVPEPEPEAGTMAETGVFSEDDDSSCSTPYVSAPSSPGRGQPHSGFYYECSGRSYAFRIIRPMKLSTHLKRPQVLAPLLDLDENEEEEEKSFRGRDFKLRNRSLRRRTRSMSPLRTTSYEWQEDYEEEELEVIVMEKKEKNDNEEIKQDDEETSNETTPCPSPGSSSGLLQWGRVRKRWVFLGRSFYIEVRAKEETTVIADSANTSETKKGKQTGNTKEGKKKPVNGSGIGKRRVPPSPHELHYTTNRAQSEEARKKTFCRIGKAPDV